MAHRVSLCLSLCLCLSVCLSLSLVTPVFSPPHSTSTCLTGFSFLEMFSVLCIRCYCSIHCCIFNQTECHISVDKTEADLGNQELSLSLVTECTAVELQAFGVIWSVCPSRSHSLSFSPPQSGPFSASRIARPQTRCSLRFASVCLSVCLCLSVPVCVCVCQCQSVSVSAC